MSDTIIRSNVFVEDLALADGGTGAIETGIRRTSTGGESTLTKIDASHIKLRSTDVAVENMLGYICPTRTAIDAAITAIGSDPGIIRITGTGIAISTDLTIPSNIHLIIDNGAILTVATTKTLTINGQVEAGLYQIFSWAGTGAVVLSNTQAYPEWWGAAGDDSTDDTAEIQAALTAAHKIVLQNKTYKITSSLTMKQFNQLCGQGWNSIIKQYTDAARGVWTHDDCIVRDLKFQGTGNYTAGGEATAIQVTISPSVTQRCLIDNVWVYDWGFNGIAAGDYTTVRNCRIDTCQNEGVLVAGTHCKIINNIVKDTISWGLDTNYSDTDFIGNTLDNCGDVTGPNTTDAGGITAYAASGTLERVRAINNVIHTCSGVDAIVVTATGTAALAGIDIVGNQVEDVVTGINVALFDTATITKVNISGNQIKTYSENGIYVAGVTDVRIDGNIFTDHTTVVDYDNVIHVVTCAQFMISNNIIDGEVTKSRGINTGNGSGIASSYGKIINNYIRNCLYGAQYWADYSSDLDWSNNTFEGCTNTIVSGATVDASNDNILRRFNQGFNPIGYIDVSLPATTISLRNFLGADAMVTITGGTVTVIKVGATEAGLTTTNLTSGTVVVPAEGYISITYSSAPTWVWIVS